MPALELRVWGASSSGVFAIRPFASPLPVVVCASLRDAQPTLEVGCLALFFGQLVVDPVHLLFRVVEPVGQLPVAVDVLVDGCVSRRQAFEEVVVQFVGFVNRGVKLRDALLVEVLFLLLDLDVFQPLLRLSIEQPLDELEASQRSEDEGEVLPPCHCLFHALVLLVFAKLLKSDYIVITLGNEIILNPTLNLRLSSFGCRRMLCEVRNFPRARADLLPNGNADNLRYK